MKPTVKCTSARRLFRAMFEQGSTKSMNESTAALQLFRGGSNPKSEFNSTIDQMNSMPTTFDSTSRHDTTGLKSSQRVLSSARKKKPTFEHPFIPGQMKSSQQKPVVNKRACPLNGQAGDVALANSINVLLGGSSTKLSVTNEIDMRRSLRDLAPSSHLERKIFGERSASSTLLHATEENKLLSHEISLTSPATITKEEVSAVHVSITLPPPPPIAHHNYEPATPCFSKKSPRPVKQPSERTANCAAKSKKDDLHNMTQDALREMVLQESPRYPSRKKISVPMFICVNNGDAEGMSLLEKEVEALRAEVLCSTVQSEPLCDSDVSSLGADEDSYIMEDEESDESH